METLFTYFGILMLFVNSSFAETYINDSLSIIDMEAMDITTTTQKPKPQMGCLDSKGDIIDWFVAYKYPREDVAEYDPDSHPYARPEPDGGYDFAYITSEDTEFSWKPSFFSLRDSDIRNSIIGVTLSQSEKLVEFFYTYNDGKYYTKDSKAHAKGTLWKSSDASGFWIVHSAPRFNPTPTFLEYPKTASKFGQIFFCMSFYSVETYDTILNHLRFINADIVASTKPLELEIEKITLLRKEPEQNNNVYYSEFYGYGDTLYKLFSRKESYEADIYDYASEILHPDGMTNRLRVVSYHTRESSENDVNQITMPILGNPANPPILPVKITWGTLTTCDQQNTKSKDHSKWAISFSDVSPGYVCFGDLNRNGNTKSYSYHRRGGGLLCFENYNLRKAFDSIISI